jgi:predicted ArsR family transcriptional regulator
MSAIYLWWAHGSTTDERAHVLRAGRAAAGPAARLRDHEAGRGTVRGRVRLATGTLYTALDRLTAEGLVELVSEETVNGRARRTYGLTTDGSAALRAEARRMAQAAALVITPETTRDHATPGLLARKPRTT